MVPKEHRSIHLLLLSPNLGTPIIVKYTTRLLELCLIFLEKGANAALDSIDKPFLLQMYFGQEYTLLQWRALYFSSLAFLSLDCPFVNDLR